MAGTIWGWAVGAKTIHGTIVGSAIGIAAALLFGYIGAAQTTRFGRRSMGFGVGAMIGGPIIVLMIVGLVIGLIRSAS